jgi:anti-sigma B factor antagonist
VELLWKEQQGIAILELPKGRLVASNAGQLGDFSDWDKFAQKAIVVDMSNLDFVDSAGIGALVAFLRKADEKQSKLCLCGLQPAVRDVFVRCRLHRVFEIFHHREQALGALA